MKKNGDGSIIERRPAETATALVGALTLVVGALLTGDFTGPDMATGIALLLVAVTPALVTAITARRRGE